MANILAIVLANFMTKFILWTGRDVGQVHDLETCMTSARVMSYDKVMILAKYEAFLAKIMALAMAMAMAMTWP